MRDFIQQLHREYKGVFVIYTLLLVGLFSPFIFCGDVVAPHRQSIELRANDIGLDKKYPENRKFTDYSNGYIPEISEGHSGSRSGWLTLWAPRNELGRPLYQLSGFTPAYFPSWVFAQFYESPWKFITVLSLNTCFLSGLFLILFFREIGLSPLAALIGAVSLAASPLFMYWLTFPMFPATWCWAAGALFGMTRIANKGDFPGWLVLAFSIYSLGMTAYPQPVVYNGYILLGYGIYLAKRQLDNGWVNLKKFLLFVLSATVVGAALVLPVYVDLVHIAANSSRVSPPPEFFLMYLPQIATWNDVTRFVAVTFFPEVFGNPIASSYTFPYDGISITPLVLFFSLIGLFGASRKTLGWWIAVIIVLILTFSPALYEFCVKCLGFNLSPSTPLGTITLPLAVIAGIGANELFGASGRGRSALVIAALLGVFGTISISVWWGTYNGLDLHWHIAIVTLVALGLLAAQIDKSRPWLVVFCLAIVIFAFSYPLMLRQSPASIAINSPLVEAVRSGLEDKGGRFAIVDSDLRVLPPNLNATLGLDSVHTYNSLSSLRYQRLISDLGGDPKFLGRWNASIAPDYNSSVFWMSNITLILAAHRLEEQNLEFLQEVSGVFLHKVKSTIGIGRQILSSSGEGGPGLFVIADPREKVIYSPVKKVDQGDLVELDLTPVNDTSVLILSQKYHRDWQATVLTASGWKIAETSVVNGIFQGVSLPPESTYIRLEFKPYARFAWVGHVFWLGMLALLAFQIWKNRHRKLNHKSC